MNLLLLISKDSLLSFFSIWDVLKWLCGRRNEEAGKIKFMIEATHDFSNRPCIDKMVSVNLF